MVVMLRHAFRSRPESILCYYEESGGRICRQVSNHWSHRAAEADGLEDVPPVPALAAWDLFSAQVREKILEKSAGYGNAWQEQGYMGNVARVLSKASRLKNLAWGDTLEDPPGDETLLDTVEDMAALCAFFSANLRSERRWGDEPDDTE